MHKLKYIGLAILGFCNCADLYAQDKSYTLKNERYEINVTAKSIRISVLNETKSARTLTPTIQVLQAMQDPRVVLKRSDNNLSPQLAWKNPQDQKKPLSDTTGELDFYKTAKIFTLQAAAVSQLNATTVRFSFKKNASFTAQLDVLLPPGNETPVIETNLQVAAKAWYSAGFTGLAAKDTSSLQFLYQPMIWTWRRFPEKSYMTPEQFATTAATFTNDGNFTEGIAPDPSEIPYRFAKLNNSRYGFILRNASGKAQPMVFAPILGGENSLMEPGQSFSFRTRYILQPGDWYAGLNHILKNIFHYKTERQNASVSLNQTLDNIINMAMNDRYGGWIDSLKGFDYVQDAIGTVKVVSALHQLGVAMVTGNEEIYNRRALPTMEYVMSREKYLYTVNEAQKIQSPSHFLKGPCVEIGELSGLYQMTNGQTPAFLSELKRLFGKPRKLNLNTETGGGSWQDYLYLYRVSKNPADLEKAKQGADAYLESWKPFPDVFTNDPGLRDKASAFLTDFTPKLYDLLELYEETKQQSYLDMAIVSARQMVLWTRSNPMAPDSNITVNKGGYVKGIMAKRYKINSYATLPGFNDTTILAEQQVPAWQTSLVGLPPEQPYTYGNGPIMLTHHPAWFLKLAYLAKDSLLKTAAYNAILGRYAGFPGYYYTSLHTNVYQFASYAMHGYWDIRYNALFHNHIFPHITLLIDFLVSDVHYRSAGKIDFPAVYAPGYAYLSSKVYGSKLGTVFGNKNVRLWLPPGAVQSTNVSFNHVLGIAENDFYVILTNTSNSEAKSFVRLNPDIIPWIGGKVYPVTIYYAEGKTAKATCKDGLLEAEVSAQGLTAYKIEGLKVEVPLFKKMTESKISASNNSFLREENTEGFGTVTGMLITTFPQFSDGYVFTDKTEKEFKQVSIEYRIGSGEWKRKDDFGYPFEFDIHLENPREKIEFKLESVDMNGKTLKSKIYSLQN